ncbi:MAG: ethanolamine utilization protein EutH [Clostridia bacterium]|nr:ethanolamine utilization protein EutH [Clostridia bacterium]
MKVVSIIMLTFAFLGSIDRLFGNKVGLGKEFEKGFSLLGQLVLSMMGMIIIAPVLAEVLSPIFDFVYNVFKIEPSIIPASLFANDMGGAPLAIQVAKNSSLGAFNGMIVASMMGATVSFTIPLALGCLKKEKHALRSLR